MEKDKAAMHDAVHSCTSPVGSLILGFFMVLLCLTGRCVSDQLRTMRIGLEPNEAFGKIGRFVGLLRVAWVSRA